MASADPERVLATAVAGTLARERVRVAAAPVAPAPAPASAAAPTRLAVVAGQGLAAFGVEGVEVTVEGGAQDGVAKAMYGGKVAVMKGPNRFGRRLNGSVGKSFAYGAQRGRLFVQGDADSRFCIRLSGADVVIGGEPAAPLDDSLGCLADRANLKGFAFEYMTAGRAVVLGDPGPWFCAGQTGGRVYLRVNEEWNLDRAALERRRGKGARVQLAELDADGERDLRELLGAYAAELSATEQDGEAERVLALAAEPAGHFLMAVPEREQMDPSVSTE
jgi:glutamate synthase (NADPH/NADH) large chain